MPVIEILGLEKTYAVGFWRKRGKPALRPLHLEVEEGEIFGFLGPNGAGKTTTLKMLMGLVFPTAGTARILGMELNDPRVKAQIGFLPEQPYFYDYLTARELLEYFAGLSGVPAKERSRRAQQMLARVGLAEASGVQLRRCCNGWGLHRPSCMNPGSSSSTSRCRGSTPWAGATCATSWTSCGRKARRFSSPPTFCRMPKRCATGWRSSIRGNCAAWGRLPTSPRGPRTRWKSPGKERRSPWHYECRARNVMWPEMRCDLWCARPIWRRCSRFYAANDCG